MDRAEFDDLFRRTVEEPLVAVGFRRQGKSLYRDGLGQAALVRGEGHLPALVSAGTQKSGRWLN